MNFTPNTILANKYKLTRPLGEGGMGCVWVADHLHLDRQVAIKVISNRVVSEPTVRDRFETEARATAKVESPHVVQVLDFDYTEEGLPFLVLELLVGETLEQRLGREGVLSLNDARELMKQTTHALTEAHQSGILHRDIKADNLFLVARDDFFVKLLDFGIAIRSDRASHPDASVDPQELSPIGTPLYMSPEQTLALGGIDERSDLYSLAVCMYYALTGDFPYCADSLAVLAFAQQREEFTVPSALRPELGSSIDAFFLRALAFHPEDRFATADKMCEAFAKACDRREATTTQARTVRPRAVARLEGGMAVDTAATATTSRRRRRGITLLVAGVTAAAGFLLVPSAWPTTSKALSSTAAFVATRLPTAQVSAATEQVPEFRVDRSTGEYAQSSARPSLLALPIAVAPTSASAVAPSVAVAAAPKSAHGGATKTSAAPPLPTDEWPKVDPPSTDSPATPETDPTPAASTTVAAPTVTDATASASAAEPDTHIWIERK